MVQNKIPILGCFCFLMIFFLHTFISMIFVIYGFVFAFFLYYFYTIKTAGSRHAMLERVSKPFGITRICL